MTTPAERTEAVAEPTQAQIDEAVAIGKLFDNPNESPEVCAARCFAHIRRETKNAALEEAAKRFDRMTIECGINATIHCEYASTIIRALKDQP